jgi:hypothetical protein
MAVALALAGGLAHAQATGSDSKAQLQVIVSDRNGGPLLGLVVQRIQALVRDDKFSQYLKRPQPTPDETKCLAAIPADRGTDVFATARCANVWPPQDRAPELQVIERTFQVPVSERGISALPAINVSAFDSYVRLKLAQFNTSLDDTNEAAP